MTNFVGSTDPLRDYRRVTFCSIQFGRCAGGAAGGRRGALQLWQFLVALLGEGARCVAWTGRGLEFKLHEPEEVRGRGGGGSGRGRCGGPVEAGGSGNSRVG